jgi:hypothetical protein
MTHTTEQLQIPTLQLAPIETYTLRPVVVVMLASNTLNNMEFKPFHTGASFALTAHLNYQFQPCTNSTPTPWEGHVMGTETITGWPATP